MESINETIEAIVFASGTPIAKKDIIEKIPTLTTSELNAAIKALQKKYSGGSGVLFLEFNGKLQFTSNTAYGDVVADVLTPLKEKELTKTLLEVLSAIAYKQPITRMEIEHMRGEVSAEYALSALLKVGLIEVKGRKEDALGKPMLYGTTDEFLKKFELTSLEELPDLVEVLEKIQLIYTPPQDTLFKGRKVFDENGNLVDAEILPDSDADGGEEEETADILPEEDEIPDFLEGEKFDVIE